MSRLSVLSHRSGQFGLRLLLGAVATLAATAVGAQAAAPPAWWSYDRPATFGAVRTAVKVPMRDGVHLGCRLSLPTTGGMPVSGKVPAVVYDVTPYAILDPFLAEQGTYFARHGYAAVTCTVRGTGSSEGTYPQINQPAEQTDAYDLVEWVAAQPWSDGRVGQTGESYGAMSTYRAAAARPPHLDAIAPQQAPNDLYLDDVYPGGVRATPVLHQWWPLIGSLTSLGRVDAARMFAVQARHPTRDAFWKQIAIDRVLDRVQVPVLAFAGWNDPLFRNGSLRNVERLDQLGNGQRTWLVSGPWEHGYVINWQGCKIVPGCVGFNRVAPGALLAWFDHWVADRPDAPLPDARVTSYRSGPAPGWHTFPRLDAFQTTPPTTMYLRADATLGDQPTASGSRQWRATPLAGVATRVDALTYRSAPLPDGQALVGRPEVTLAFRSTATDANLHATLRLVTADTSKVLGQGWLKASHRNSQTNPQPLVPHREYTAQIPLQPLDTGIPAGAHVELRIDSGSAQQVVPVSRPLTVSIGPGSTLTLPLTSAG